MSSDYHIFDQFTHTNDVDGENDNFLPTSSTLPPSLRQAPIGSTGLSDDQERLLSLLVVISGILSTIGSTTIVYKVVKNFYISKPYDRLLLGLSCCDIVASLTYAVSPFFLPSSTSHRIWAMGNATTCNYLGFFTQFAFSSTWYNCMLSFYYLLTVRLAVKRNTFATTYEPWIHFSCLLYNLGTALYGLIVDLYGELALNIGCWIYSSTLAWFFAGIPTVITFFAIPINNLIIYCYVRRMLPRNMENTNDGEKTTETNPKQPTPKKQKKKKTSSKEDESTQQAVDESSESSSSSSHPCDPNTNDHLGLTRTASFRSSSSRSSTTTTDELQLLRHQHHIREVASQGFLYVGTFMVCILPAFMVRILAAPPVVLTAEDEPQFFWLLCLNNALLPLQGFLNMFVYTRPNYIRVRGAYPNQPILWAIQKACFDSHIPRLTQSYQFQTGNTNNSNGSHPNNGGGSSGSKKGSKVSSSGHKKGSNFSSDLGIVMEGSLEEDDYFTHDDDEMKSPEKEVDGELSLSSSSSCSTNIPTTTAASTTGIVSITNQPVPSLSPMVVDRDTTTAGTVTGGARAVDVASPTTTHQPVMSSSSSSSSPKSMVVVDTKTTSTGTCMGDDVAATSTQEYKDPSRATTYSEEDNSTSNVTSFASTKTLDYGSVVTNLTTQQQKQEEGQQQQQPMIRMDYEEKDPRGGDDDIIRSDNVEENSIPPLQQEDEELVSTFTPTT